MGNIIVHQVGTAHRGLYTLKLAQKSLHCLNLIHPPLPVFVSFAKAGIHFPLLYQFKNNSWTQSIFLHGWKGPGKVNPTS